MEVIKSVKRSKRTRKISTWKKIRIEDAEEQESSINGRRMYVKSKTIWKDKKN
jgi:hypothetical protein